jgi:hypothetical protein
MFFWVPFVSYLAGENLGGAFRKVYAYWGAVFVVFCMMGVDWLAIESAGSA